MFDIGSSELLLIVIVAVVVIGPKDLPRVLYKLGQIIGKGRAMTRHFRSGIDEMIRQAELEEMQKKWAADNARIMAETPAASPVAPAEGETPDASHVLPAPAHNPAGDFDPPHAEAEQYEVGHHAPSNQPEHDPAATPVAHPDPVHPPVKPEGGTSA